MEEQLGTIVADIPELFEAFLKKNRWFDRGERVLLAVSGGLDSMVMAHLFRHSPIAFGIAHCNFQLRGVDADEDEAFVQATAAAWGVPFFVERFPTQEYTEKSKTSVQVAARDLRYNWLEKIRSDHDYHWVATAHHLNDSIETALYNWTKGSGLRGLLGIPIENDQIIRPLMFADRAALEHYGRLQDIDHRIDASNLEDKYSRNKLRHHVWPVLKQINPALEETFHANLERLREVEMLYDWALTTLGNDWTKESDSEFRIAISPLQDFPAARTLLFEWLKKYHFSSRQAAQIHSSLSHAPGAVFYSASHRLLLDREWLIVRPLNREGSSKSLSLHKDSQTLELPEGKLVVSLEPGRPETFANAPAEICLDLDSLHFPLHLRRWQAGDRFAPLGLGGHHQKLQDFFSNQKISLFDKEKVWLLVNGDGEIAWVIGYRMAETFKITDKTKNYLRLHFQKL